MSTPLYALKLNSEDVYHVYGVNSSASYTIYSTKSIARVEKEKIQSILGTFRAVELVEEQREIRVRKFQDYVAYLPRERWKEKAEYGHYESWQQDLTKATQVWNQVKEKYQIDKVVADAK